MVSAMAPKADETTAACFLRDIGGRVTAAAGVGDSGPASRAVSGIVGFLAAMAGLGIGNSMCSEEGYEEVHVMLHCWMTFIY